LKKLKGHCPGIIREPSTCQVDISPPPSLVIDPLPLVSCGFLSLDLNPPHSLMCFFLFFFSFLFFLFFFLLSFKACLGEASSTVILKVTGQPPWKVVYVHTVKNSTNAIVESHQQTTEFSKSPHTLQLNPTVPGLHEYTFIQLTDKLYINLSLNNSLLRHAFTVFE
jgi:hypothetical protein